ncbi:putative exostosin [Helianthus anomalus]
MSFESCGLCHFVSLVQRFHFSSVGPKRFHRCHFSPLGVSPLVGLRDHGFVAGQAITKAEAGKVAKHEKACIENQHVFVPFALDTFGALAPDAVPFLKRVQQVVSSNTAHVKVQNFVFSRVGFAIQNFVFSSYSERGSGAACCSSTCY